MANKFKLSPILAIILINPCFALESNVDNFGRLINFPGKIEVNCPLQKDKTAVLLAIGQSNAANYAEKKFTTKYPEKVINYFDGKCYVASSPLLGATGDAGEFLTPLADRLIANGDFDSVVIISSAIGGTPIDRWQKGGDLNSMLVSVLAKAKSTFKVTAVIWHQGEADFAKRTNSEDYRKQFKSLIETIRLNGKATPAFYYAIATKCGDNPEWTLFNPTSKAQQKLSSLAKNIYLGADTDTLLLAEDRLLDRCHFSEKGQLKTANAFAKVIHDSNSLTQ